MTAHAAVPAFVPYSGRLTDGTFAGQSVVVNLTARLYSCGCPFIEDCSVPCPDGSEGLVFAGKHLGVRVVDGYFTVQLGAVDADGNAPANPGASLLPAPLPSPLWITVEIAGGAEMRPRQALGSVPFALACDALGARETTGYVWNQGATPQTGGFLLAGDCALSEGNLGIGVSPPKHAVHARRPTSAYQNAMMVAETAAATDVVGLGVYNTLRKWDVVNAVSTTPDYLGFTPDVGTTTFEMRVDGALDVPRRVRAGRTTEENTYGDAVFAARGKSDVVGFGLYNATQKWDLVNAVSPAADYLGFVNGSASFFMYTNGTLEVPTAISVRSKCTLPSSVGTCVGDVAEMFQSLDGAQAGDVVVLDTTAIQGLRLSTSPYDPLVAGIVSSNPTVVMGRGDLPGSVPVALSGVVPTNVSSDGGTIAVGDLLTTSSRPGHAMRADRAGPIIGKALEPFSGPPGATGSILVLVASGATTNRDCEADRERLDDLEAQVSDQARKLTELRREIESLKTLVRQRASNP